jgi:glycerophosphoryl diester phosphodiesterase
VSRRFVQSAARAGDAVWSYVVNDVVQLQQQRALGVAGCFCTRPAELLRALGTPAARARA